MELRTALEQRRMIRSFDGTPVDVTSLQDLCAQALRAPTAGNSAGVYFVVGGVDQVPAYLEVATDADWRARSRRVEGLARAGAVVLVASDPESYLSRYAAADKASSGLRERDAWTVPYWHTDAAMATMALLLLLEEAGWHATLWGNFRHDDAVKEWAGIPPTWELFGTVLLGRADGADHRSASLDRPTPTRAERVLRVR